MTRDDMLVKLLEALVEAWSETHSAADIRQDLGKIRLLNDARASISGGAPSLLVQDFYKEVFLRDVWSGDRR
jgi:hypothetical protein